MKIKKLYKSVTERNGLWNYYNKDLTPPLLTDTEDCFRFIREYINYSEKSISILDDLRILKERSPRRLSHIVSTFFLGLWLFHHPRGKFIHDAIIDELKRLKCFGNNVEDIEEQFTFVWFMATLFHDLGYPAEEKEDGTALPHNEVPFVGGVPEYYRYTYQDYYAYRKNKEHGIYAGLIFDENVCRIREYREMHDSNLDWREDLEELYHYVAWIIMSHNIWLKRDNDSAKEIDEYKNNYLDNLILSSKKNDENRYLDYAMNFYVYPLFTFFCIVDTIEPLKSSSCLSEIDIDLKKDKIIVKSNDSVFCNKVLELNEWLLPTMKSDDVITLYLD